MGLGGGRLTIVGGVVSVSCTYSRWGCYQLGRSLQRENVATKAQSVRALALQGKGPLVDSRHGKIFSGCHIQSVIAISSATNQM
jgi:hypothetical protein